MIGNLAFDAVLVLLVCAVVLGLIALYHRNMDPEVIDEEAEAQVEQESSEERAEALRKEEVRRERTQAEDMDGHYVPDDQ